MGYRVAVVGARHQRVEGAGLERGVLDRRVVRQAGTGEGPHVQSTEQSVVDDVSWHPPRLRRRS